MPPGPRRLWREEQGEGPVVSSPASQAWSLHTSAGEWYSSNLSRTGWEQMDTLLLSMVQLIIVALVYVFAYRSGFKAAQAKASHIVRELAFPMERLIESLDRSVDEAIEREKKRQGN